MTVLQMALLGDDVEIKSDHDWAIQTIEAQSHEVSPFTVASISGGKSSAYMAIHYPADAYVFALVRTTDPNCRIQDSGLRRAVEAKCPAEFVGSREVDQTLRNVLRLEQELGKEIRWVTGPTFDELIAEKKALPNWAQRFCTKEMKVGPIFERVFAFHGEMVGDCPRPIGMQIGFRSDEPRRVYKALGATVEKGGFDWSNAGGCERFPVSLHCDIVGKFAGSRRWRETFQWRIKQFPMFLGGVTNYDVISYWQKRGWVWPEVSNCDFCYLHQSDETRRQAELYPDRVQWWAGMENKIGKTFAKGASYAQILKGAETPLFDDCECTD